MSTPSSNGIDATAYDKRVALVEKLFNKEDFNGAASEATKVLDDLEPTLPAIAKAALFQAMSTMTQAMNEMAESGEKPPMELFENVWEALELSRQLDPECDATTDEMAEVAQLLKEMPRPDPPKEVASADFDVLVVGAGAAGIGCALMLTETFGLDKSRVMMVERGEEVGETFRRWPKEMRFISPSFNQQGWTDSFDLNSISKGTSPAFSLHTEHPSGNEYAAYLTAIVKTNELKVLKQTEVVSVSSIGTEELPLFSVDIRWNGAPKEESADPKPVTETVKARYIVWAAGEFQYPRAPDSTATEEGTEAEEKKSEEVEGSVEEKESKELPGSELCLHNSQVRSWAEVPGDEFIVIGGYESGVDASVNLAKAGKQCRVLASTPCWSIKTEDPSSELAPYTAARLRDVLAPGFMPKPQLFAPLRVVRIEKAANGGFDVTAEWQAEEEGTHAPLRELVNSVPTETPSAEGSTLVLHTPNPPILCTGFEGSVAAAAGHLFEFADSNGKNKGCLDGAPLLTEDDESTKVPGVFLVGPTVSQKSHSFCFVYKFRQRFAIVANSICDGLGVDTKMAVAECRKNNMYLDDLACCEDTCGDVC